jgi:hypothetical protein
MDGKDLQSELAHNSQKRTADEDYLKTSFN